MIREPWMCRVRPIVRHVHVFTFHVSIELYYVHVHPKYHAR